MLWHRPSREAFLAQGSRVRYSPWRMSEGDLQFAARTDVGRQRDHNEDNYLVDKKLSLFVVCDGMGGHAAGEVASALAVRTIHEEVKRERDLVQDYAAVKSGGDRVSKRDLLNMLEFAVNRASRRIHAEAAKDGQKRGMGTTLAAVLLVGHQASSPTSATAASTCCATARSSRSPRITPSTTSSSSAGSSREQIEKVAQKNAITRASASTSASRPTRS